MITQPTKLLIQHWNWKAAAISCSIRIFLFFITNLTAGWHAATNAALVELMIRPILTGVLGALTQALRFAEPMWLSTLIVMLGLPLISHGLEFLAHWAGGTARIAYAISVSIGFSVVSGLLNLYLMRRGVLIVGEPDAASVRSDLYRLPRLLASFIAAGPLAAYRFFQSRLNGKKLNVEDSAPDKRLA